MRVAREVRPPFFRCGISSAVFFVCGVFCLRCFLSAVFFVCGVFCFCIISALILDRVGSRKDAKTQRRREREIEIERRREARVPRSNEA